MHFNLYLSTVSGWLSSDSLFCLLQTVAYMKERVWIIILKAKEKWYGRTEGTTKANGPKERLMVMEKRFDRMGPFVMKGFGEMDFQWENEWSFSIHLPIVDHANMSHGWCWMDKTILAWLHLTRQPDFLCSKWQQLFWVSGSSQSPLLDNSPLCSSHQICILSTKASSWKQKECTILG